MFHILISGIFLFCHSILPLTYTDEFNEEAETKFSCLRVSDVSIPDGSNRLMSFTSAAGVVTCTPILAPYSENFDGSSWGGVLYGSNSGTVDACWSRNLSVDFQWGAIASLSGLGWGPSSDHTPGSGGKFIATIPVASTTNNQPYAATITSPQISLASLSTPEMSFWYHMQNTNVDSLVVHVFDGNTWNRVHSIVGYQQTSQTAPWQEAIVNLSAFSFDTIEVRFVGYGTSLFGYLPAISVDDFSIYQGTYCPEPSNVFFSSINPSGFTLNWSSLGTVTVELTETGQSQGSGRFYYNAVSPLAISGLLSNTSYDVYLRDSCSALTQSQWVDTSQVTASCPAIGAAFTHNNIWFNVGFNSGATTNADSIYWDFGDGVNSSIGNPSHLYAASGSYIVTMEAFSDCGDIAVVFDTIQVCDTLTADFNITRIADSVKFDASISGNAIGYIWSIDGTDTIGGSITFRFTSSGTKTVTLTAYNECGDSATVSKTVYVCPAPKANWTYSIISTTSSGMTVQFDGSSSQNAVTYNWDFGDGSSGTGVNPLHSYAVPGLSYVVKLTVKDTCNSEDDLTGSLSSMGVVDIDASNSIKIYPNPADEYFTVRWNLQELDVNELVLVTATGKFVKQITANSYELGELKLKVDQYPAGTYFIKVLGTKGEVKVIKIFIQ